MTVPRPTFYPNKLGFPKNAEYQSGGNCSVFRISLKWPWSEGDLCSDVQLKNFHALSGELHACKKKKAAFGEAAEKVR